jgi:preprotein translocase subunit SecA
MKPAALTVPGLLTGGYPERDFAGQTRGEARTGLRAPAPVQRHRQRRFVTLVERHCERFAALIGPAWLAAVREVRTQLAADGFADEIAAQAFALAREATRRTLGKSQFHTQIIAARSMLSGRLAEMATGEGKTLAAVLTAATAALAGIPVHVLTANDYLVGRDAELLTPVFALLGLTVGAVTRPLDQAQRRAAYACDITYCTAKELTFDYLRDRLVRRRVQSALHERVRRMEGGDVAPAPLLLRGLCMAIVDEADSILIDEARTPLILSQPRINPQKQLYIEQALQLAVRLTQGADFQVDTAVQEAVLTEAGRAKLAELAAPLGGLWQDRRHRDEIVVLALAAHHVFHRDKHYLVRERKVIMIDQTTGRVAPGRMWSRGLQQLLEVKERCPPSGEQETIAQITYQRFFPRYHYLCGMSGTLAEARAELRSVYGLSIEEVPLRRPCRRKQLPVRVFATREAKWDAVIERLRALHEAGRPVLVGTDSVADSDHLSVLLAAARLPHVVLNARNDSEEATIVARAGEPGRITVTTNMAGRGTDIPLAPGVAQRGGLHVICCQHNASPRIDRQLHGRAGRQGDPGSVETILSLEDGLLARMLAAWLRAALAAFAARNRPLPAWLGARLAWYPQKLEERRQRAERRLLLEQDERAERRLSFAGRGE